MGIIDGVLTPIYTGRTAAPDSVLRIVSCGCKKGSGKRYSFRKAGLDSSAMCSTCLGQNCANATQLISVTLSSYLPVIYVFSLLY